MNDDVDARARLAAIVDPPDIPLDETKCGRFPPVEHVIKVSARSGREVVESDNALAQVQQLREYGRSDKARNTGYEPGARSRDQLVA